MKFALINGQRQEAQPNLSGQCLFCDQAMIAKCGEVKIWHWAHKGRRLCDTWWENETEWHRAWKDCFPKNWQEVVHRADDGQKHIADIKTDQGWVIEFQHSYIKPEERRSRNAFYQKLIWVIDGTRLKRDGKQLQNAMNECLHIVPNSPIRLVSSEKCVLLREWGDSPVPVLFDFGGPLWWLFKGVQGGLAYIAPFSRSEFIEIHCGGPSQKAQDFDKFVKDIGKMVSQYESSRRARIERGQRGSMPGFRPYPTHRRKPSRRL